VSVGNDRYYKPFIFCIVQIVSVAGADTKYRFPTDTINTFCCSVGHELPVRRGEDGVEGAVGDATMRHVVEEARGLGPGGGG
jgi:hypothetical protein